MSDDTTRRCQCGQPVVPGQYYCQEYADILNEPDPWREIEEREQEEMQRGWNDE